MPLVTIITTSFNQSRFIQRALESVLAQSFGDWEQIIVDDGSTDSTVEVVKPYCRKDPRIHFVQHEHVGFRRLSELYNAGLVAARGRLIAVLEADDYWPPWKLERQIQAFADEDVVLAWGNVLEVNEQGLALALNPSAPKQYLDMQRNEMIRKLLFHNYIPAVSVMCRKSALQQIGGFRQPHNIYSVDYPTWLALAPLGEFKFIDYVLGYLVKHSDSLSSRFSSPDNRTALIEALCAVRDCSIDAISGMPDELRKDIGVTREELERTRDVSHQFARLIYRNGWSLLRQRDWAGANKGFRDAFPYASLADKSRALLLIAVTEILMWCPIDLGPRVFLLRK